MMSKAVNHSLRRRLIERLLAWQIATLVLLAVSIVAILYFVDDRDERSLDTGIATTIADAVRNGPSGLELAASGDLDALRDGSPPLWFVVVDQQGQRLVSGDVPGEMRAFVESLPEIDSLSIESGTSGLTNAALEIEESAAGEVRVLFGGGPPPHQLWSLLAFAVQDVTPFALLVLAVIAAMTVLIVPKIIAQSMSGLATVVSEASAIKFDKRGARLTSSEVPEEVIALVDAINGALERLDRGYARQERFLADAAHELKTPIAILQNRLELAEDNMRNNRVLLDVYRIANLAEQLLDLQRVEYADAPTQTVDLVALGNRVVADLAPIALEAGYEPAFASSLGALSVLGDAGAIERAMINLVQNAIAYGGNSGTIELSIHSDRTVEISDEGPGIPDERRDWIFEPFHRIKPRDQGAGLGLSLVREIMRRHNGTVSVETSASGGARFILRFPPVKT